MWQSPCGPAWCEGLHARIVYFMLVEMAYDLRDEEEGFKNCPDPYQRRPETVHPMMRRIWKPHAHACFGAVAIDNLDWNQKLALLAEAGDALLRKDVQPARTLYLDGMIYSVWEHFSFRVAMGVSENTQVTDPNGFHRAMAAQMLAEQNEDGFYPWPGFECLEEDRWEQSLNQYFEQFMIRPVGLHFPENYLDAHPDEARRLLQEQRLPDDYFSAAAPDPTESEMAVVRDRLQRLFRDFQAALPSA